MSEKEIKLSDGLKPSSVDGPSSDHDSRTSTSAVKLSVDGLKPGTGSSGDGPGSDHDSRTSTSAVKLSVDGLKPGTGSSGDGPGSDHDS